MADTNSVTKSKIRVARSKMKSDLAELPKYLTDKVPNEILRFGDVFVEYATDASVSSYKRQLNRLARDVREYIGLRKEEKKLLKAKEKGKSSVYKLNTPRQILKKRSLVEKFDVDEKLKEIQKTLAARADTYSGPEVFLDNFKPAMEAADSGDILKAREIYSDVSKNKSSDIKREAIKDDLTNRMLKDNLAHTAEVFAKCLKNVDFDSKGGATEYEQRVPISDAEFNLAMKELEPENFQKKLTFVRINKLTNDITENFKQIAPHMSINASVKVYRRLMKALHHENFEYAYRVLRDARDNVKKSVNKIDPSGKTWSDMNHYFEIGIPEWYMETAVLSDDYMKPLKGDKKDSKKKKIVEDPKKIKMKALISLDDSKKRVRSIEDKIPRKYIGSMGADDLYYKRLEDAAEYFEDRFEDAPSRREFLEYLESEDIDGLRGCVEESLFDWSLRGLKDDELYKSLKEFKSYYLDGPESLDFLRARRLPISDIRDFITLQYSLQGVEEEDIHKLEQVMESPEAMATGNERVTISFIPKHYREGAKVSDVELQVGQNPSFNVSDSLNGAVAFYKTFKEYFDVPVLNPMEAIRKKVKNWRNWKKERNLSI